MFPRAFFAGRQFAPRYFPGGVPVAPTPEPENPGAGRSQFDPLIRRPISVHAWARLRLPVPVLRGKTKAKPADISGAGVWTLGLDLALQGVGTATPAEIHAFFAGLVPPIELERVMVTMQARQKQPRPDSRRDEDDDLLDFYLASLTRRH